MKRKKVNCAKCDKSQEDLGKRQTCVRCGTSPLPSYSYPKGSGFHPSDLEKETMTPQPYQRKTTPSLFGKSAVLVAFTVISSGLQAGTVPLRTVGPPIDQLFHVTVEAEGNTGGGGSFDGAHYTATMDSETMGITSIEPIDLQGSGVNFAISIGEDTAIFGTWGIDDIYLRDLGEDNAVPIPEFNEPIIVNGVSKIAEGYDLALDGPYWRGSLFLGTVMVNGSPISVNLVEAGFGPRSVHFIPEPSTWILVIIAFSIVVVTTFYLRRNPPVR